MSLANFGFFFYTAKSVKSEYRKKITGGSHRMLLLVVGGAAKGRIACGEDNGGSPLPPEEKQRSGEKVWHCGIDR